MPIAVPHLSHLRCQILRPMAGFVFLTFATLALIPTAYAQTERPGQEDEKIPTLELVTDPALKSARFGATEGEVDTKGLRFAVGGLSILQPVVVSLMSEVPGEELRLSIFKQGWSGARRSGSTGTSGAVQFQFRTEGGMNILVEGPSRPARFVLAVVAGDEVQLPMKDVFLPVGGASQTSLPAAGGTPTKAGGSTLVPWIVAAVLGAVVAVFAMRFLARRKGHE